MELTKQPETETEYWEAIEGLGGFVWRTNHDFAHRRIQDPTGRISKDIQDAREISRRLLCGLKEKFGVIPPEEYPKTEVGQKLPPAPEGKIYYSDWYNKMKQLVYQMDYEKIICSACPFSEGVEKMIRLGGVIPCSVWNGMLYRLSAPHVCGKVGAGWSQEKLEQEILIRGGEVALIRFRIKEVGLKSLFDPATGGIRIQTSSSVSS